MFRMAGAVLLSLLFCTTVRPLDDAKKELVTQLAVLMIDRELISQEQEKIEEDILKSTLEANAKVFEKLIEQVRDEERITRLKSSFQNRQSRLKKSLKEKLSASINLLLTARKIYFQVYYKYFEEEELKQLIRFYSSPIGKKLVRVTSETMPKIKVYMQEKLEPLIMDVTRDATVDAQNTLKEFIEEDWQ